MVSSNIKSLWTCVSGLGALIGTSIGMRVFPGAAFAANPTGEFGWHLVGFALSVGIFFAILQWIILRLSIESQGTTKESWTDLWLPVSTLGIAATMLPLWWIPADVLLVQPFIVVISMLPGGFALGLGQRFILSRFTKVKFGWLVPTSLGVALGGFVGLIIAVWTPFPVEHTWALLFGVSVGTFQSRSLARFLESMADQRG